MKKRIILIVLILLLPTFFARVVHAQNISGTTPSSVESTEAGKNIYPLPPDNTGINFLGQDHYYSIVFRGNGEAVVTAKVILSNTFSLPLKSVDLQFNQVTPKDIIVYQVIRDPVCLRYSEPQLLIYPKIPLKNQVCVQYQEPDYSEYYYDGNSSYQKASYEVKGDHLVISLPKEIKPNGSGSFILYFRGFGYSEKDPFGAFHYTFETLKVSERIRTLQVGVDTDSDLFLAGVKGKVNYNITESVATLKSGDASMPIRNPGLDNFYQNIGSGSIVKTASNLQSMESYKVSGSYADSLWKLYGKELIIGIFIFLLVLIVSALFLKFFLRKGPQGSKDSSLAVLFETLGISFISSFLVFSYTLVLYLFTTYKDYIYSYNYPARAFVDLFLVVLSVGVYGLLLFGPVILIGLKRSWVRAVVTFGATIFWLVLYLLITLVIVMMFFRNTAVPYRIFPSAESGVMMKSDNNSGE